MTEQLEADRIQGLVPNAVPTAGAEEESDLMSVLVVDDEPAVADLTATYLERESNDFEVIQESSAEKGLEHIGTIDAIVSDYDMPKTNGLEFLQAVRAERPELPFILFTGRGNEEIASEAISEGVTDYLQKGGDSSTYSVLANRLKNSIDRYWASQALRRSERRFSRLVENASDVITIVDENARFKYVSPSATEILGYEPGELVGDLIFEYAHPDDRQHAMEKFFRAIENPDVEPVVNFRFKHADGSWPVLESRGRNLLDDNVINGFVVNSRDITDLKDREAELERHNERLRGIKRTLSEDISNHLDIVSGSLDLYRETDDTDQLDRVELSVTRIEELLEQVIDFSDRDIDEPETELVSLKGIVTDVWELTDAEGAEFRLNESKRIEADPGYLKHLLGNLFENAVEHNPSPVEITVGMLENGFYIQDDGDGFGTETPSDLFESGYSTVPENVGFGLTIVDQIVQSHGWEITVTDDDGTRFEITGVSISPEIHD